MYPPAVSGGAVVSKVLLVGQAPGDKEPKPGNTHRKAWLKLTGKLKRAFAASCDREIPWNSASIRLVSLRK
jgi:hypothetical protein